MLRSLVGSEMCIRDRLGLCASSKYLRSVRAYTMWNCAAVVTNFALKLRWERPLVCNSLAIFASYRTASVDAHEDLRRRAGLGPFWYFVGDNAVHLLPLLVLVRWLVKHEQFCRPQHGAFALLGQLFFAFSQGGQMDMGQIYVPHDVPFAWAAVGLGPVSYTHLTLPTKRIV
eukprot:TRINITY_DN3169_c0_g1_i1.p1 TRINITY_DN3169_c0_g1~~TRINITY_DN3169_c0_g1_i1.p1  ORF type:complete len:172 (+),score=36.80 TRINITY_DN3169_c0_g1_i1:139-654(+)